MKVTIYLVLQSHGTIQDFLKRGVDKISDEAEIFGSRKSKFPMFYRVIIRYFEPLDQSGFLVVKTFTMSTYVLYQKARLLKRFPEPLPDFLLPSPRFPRG